MPVTWDSHTLQVTYSWDAQEADAWVAAHFPLDGPADAPRMIMGLDAEWKPVFGRSLRPPRLAVVQVSDAAGHVLVLHVCHLRGGVFPARLSAALASPRVLKVGVGVLEDANKIHLHTRSPVEACLDLAGAHLAHTGAGGPPTPGLYRLANQFLSLSNWKSKSVTVRGGAFLLGSIFCGSAGYCEQLCW